MRIDLIIFFCCTLIVFVTISCSPKEQKKKNDVATKKIEQVNYKYPIKINLPQTKKNDLKVSFFADTIIYIALETNNNSFLQRVTDVRMNDSVIVISDMRRVLLFHRDGTFIRQIGQRGNGPKEYGTIGKCQLYKDTIFIGHKRSISKFTIDGEFRGSKMLPHQPGFFTPTSNKRIALYDEYEGKIYFYDTALNLKDTLIAESNVSPDRTNFQIFDPADAFFQISKDKLLFTNYKSDTIWDFSGAEKKATYITNLQDKLLPWNKQVEYFKGDFEHYKKVAEPYQKVNLKEYSKYLFITQKSWGTGKVNTIYVHNFFDNSTNAFNPDYIYDDLIGNIKLQARLSFSTDEYIITALKAHELVESLNELKNNTPINNPNHEVWKKKMLKIKFDDNPVLVLMKPKDIKK